MNLVTSLLLTIAFAVPPSNTSGIKMGTGNGVIRVVSGNALIDTTTDNLPEGSNLYLTNSRVDSRITLQKAASNGLATLDGSGKIPSTQLPAIAITNTYVVGSQIAMLALVAETGDVAIRTDLSKTYILSSDNPGTLADWKEILSPLDTITSVNGQTGAVSLSTSNISEGSNLYFTNGRAQSAISAASPLTYSSGSVSCQTASSSQAGCLSSANWSTFNSKFGSVTYTTSTPSRTLNSNFTPSSTNAVFVSYSIGMTCTASLSGGQTSTIELRSDTNATPTTVRASISAGNSVSIAISLTAINTQTVSLNYLVPPGHNVRLVSSGTCTSLSIVSQSEVAIAFN